MTLPKRVRERLGVAPQGMEIEVLHTPRGGAKTGVLPDFFIGAHAAIAHLPLLTRDLRRLKSYFPTVELISP